MKVKLFLLNKTAGAIDGVGTHAGQVSGDYKSDAPRCSQ